MCFKCLLSSDLWKSPPHTMQTPISPCPKCHSAQGNPAPQLTGECPQPPHLLTTMSAIGKRRKARMVVFITEVIASAGVRAAQAKRLLRPFPESHPEP